MTTLNREEIIEAMCRAYFNSTFTNEKGWDDVFEQTRAAFRISMGIALDALIDALPPVLDSDEDSFLEHEQLENGEYYKQLLSLKRE